MGFFRLRYCNPAGVFSFFMVVNGIHGLCRGLSCEKRPRPGGLAGRRVCHRPGGPWKKAQEAGGNVAAQ